MRKSEAIELLQRTLAAIGALPTDEAAGGPGFQKWQRSTRVAVEHVFGTGSRHAEEISEVTFNPMTVRDVRNPAVWQRRARSAQAAGIAAARALIESMVEEITDHWPDDSFARTRDDSVDASTLSSTDASEAAASLRVNDLVGYLDFVGEHDEQLRDVIVADIGELDGAIRAGLHKATMLLIGSILEGVLLDVLDRRSDLAGSYMKKGRKFPEDASLDDLLTIAADTELIGGGKLFLSATTRGMGAAIKEHRDLIHPHRQVRGSVVVDQEAAGGMVALLRLVMRDIKSAADAGAIVDYVNK